MGDLPPHLHLPERSFAGVFEGASAELIRAGHQTVWTGAAAEVGRNLGVGTLAIGMATRIGAPTEKSGWKGNVSAINLLFSNHPKCLDLIFIYLLGLTLSVN